MPKLYRASRSNSNRLVFTVARTVVRGNLSPHLYQNSLSPSLNIVRWGLPVPWFYWVCKIHHKSLRTIEANIYLRKISLSSLFAPRDGAMIPNCFWVFPQFFVFFLWSIDKFWSHMIFWSSVLIVDVLTTHLFVPICVFS